MNNTKYLFLIIMITLFGFINLNGVSYTEDFVLDNNNSSRDVEAMTNGDLEAWDNTSTPSDWDKTESIAQESSIVHSGTYSAKQTAGTKDLGQYVDVVGGQTYTISYWFFDNDSDAKSRIWSYWRNGTSNLSDNLAELRPGTYSSDSSEWQQVTHTLEAPATADNFYFEVRTYKDGGSGVIYYDDFSVLSSGGNNPPTVTTIVLTPATNITSSNSVSVSAVVTDDDTVYSVVLNWGTTEGSLTNNISMTNGGSGNTYTTTTNIPAQSQGTEVFYQISATDNDSAVTTSTETSYTVLSNATPSITNIATNPSTTDITSSTTVSVSADITDSDGTIAGAELHWGTTSGSLSTTIDMSVSTGDTYITDSDIPVNTDGTTVYYEIYALDNESGESTSTEASYTVEDPLPLTADFTASATTIFSGSSITFTDGTTGGDESYSYAWDFNNDTTVDSTDENPDHTYTTIGTYTVTLTVTDGNSDTDAETKTDYIVVEEAPEGATDLFFSEYIEGSSNNKAIEIFNGTGSPVDLSIYKLKKGTNGADFSTEYSLSDAVTTLANGDVVVITNSAAVSDIRDEEDAFAGIITFNGDDAMGLFKNGTLIDVIGLTTGTDPGSGWNVAGEGSATANHTLVRKSSIFEGNTDWTASAGTDSDDSEWIVYDQDDFDYIGSHVFTYSVATEFSVDFEADVTSGDPSLTVAFTSTVYGGTTPYTYSWDFDGDDTEDSTLENPSFTYTEAGVYTVSLNVTDDATADSTVVKTAYITVNDTSVEGYYDDITETTGSALKAQLATLISTNTSTDYDESRAQMYSEIDNINNTVTGVYSGLAVSHTYGTTTAPAGIDCEHSYPQSWLEEYETATDYAMARADIHHLFPSRTGANSSRGNRPFDYVNSVTSSWSDATGYVSYTGENVAGDDVFEVADQHKGNTARAMLYMNTRWALTLSDDGSTTGLTIDMLPILLQWCADDPVDDAERARNQAIYEYQGNRNPYVDYPNWITEIYGSASSPQVATPVISPNAGTYTNTADIIITCASTGSSIYYTTDGSTPTDSSIPYSTSFTITESQTIKAIATKTDYTDSEVATAIYTITDDATATTDLFFSEYIDPASGFNKAVEIFNGTGSDIDFNNIAYSIKLGFNGNDWTTTIDLTGTIYDNSTYVVANSSADDLNITNVVSLSHGNLNFNGNDAVGLFKGTTLIDVIGLYQNDPNSGWDVAGTDEATEDHVLIRKQHIAEGNTDWASSAGTDASDSEWTVISPIVYTNLGNHTFAPLTADFSANVTSTTVGTTITFTAVVTGGLAGYSLEWDFDNDGTIDSEITTPSHIYNQAGTYSVSLHVTDANTDEKTVTKANYITVESNMVYAGDLIISEYLSGTGNNKSVELYNGTGQTVTLTDYSIRIATAGGTWNSTINLSGSLSNDDVFVVSHPSASAAIGDQSDLTSTNLNYAGNQAVGLFKNSTAIDIVGVPGAVPSGGNSGWTVASVANATYNRTIVRKAHIAEGNTDSAEWTGTKAGETTPTSEWIVFPEDTATYLGNHDYDFGDNTLPVTLTSFTSSITYSGLGQPIVSIKWKTEAESGLIGYNILRNESHSLDGAIRNNEEIVGATNSLVGNNYSYIDDQVEVHKTYYYWLESVELSNENETFGPINIRIEDYNSNDVTIPYQTSIRSIYPNPFNPTATISFYVQNSDRVKIKVYNTKGQLVRVLRDEVYPVGFHKLNWNGRDGYGNDCSSGIYLFRMETKEGNKMMKGLLMK